jgi:hypothetical protein
MRIVEIDPRMAVDVVLETEPNGTVKPLTPERMRARKKKQDKATQNLQDVQATNAVRLQKARRRVGDV